MLLKKIEESDRDRFEGFFYGADSCHFLQSLEWGEIMRGEGWEILPYQVEDEGEIKASILILKKKISVLGGCILYAPRAPVVDFKETSVLNFLLKEVRSLGKTTKAMFLRIDPDIKEENSFFKSALLENGFIRLSETWSFWNAPKYLLRLRLDRTEEELFLRMSSSQRNQIKGARKKGVLVSSDTTLEDLGSFYDLLVQTSRLKKIPFRKFGYYESLYNLFVAKNRGKLFFANYEGEKVATGITLKMGKKSWLMYMASDEKGRKLNANRLLQWEMIIWAKKEGCTSYDFRGTAVDYPPDPKNPNYGVYAFKKEFLPDLVILTGYYDLVLMTFRYKLFRLVEKILLPFFIKVYSFFKK